MTLSTDKPENKMKTLASSWPQIIVLPFLFLFVSIAQAQTKYPCNSTDAKEIRIAALEYLGKNSAVSPNEVTLLSEQCVSSYASVIVHPIKPITDDAMMYLHKADSHWEVMTLGTAFDKEFLEKIPKELR